MNNLPSQPFFSLADDGAYIGNDGARGPWSADACHGGPVAAAVARSAELAAPSKQLARLTLDLFRPVPVAGFRVDAQLVREGRMVAVVSLRLVDREGALCATASALLMTPEDIGEIATTAWEPPDFARSQAADFPRIRGGHGLKAFADNVEVREPADSPFRFGPNTIWMRTPPLLADEPMSPFQRLCPLADCGNALSRNADAGVVRFINPDLSIHLHRLPASEWIGASFVSRWESSGMGLSTALLFDDRGLLGTAQQTLLLQRP